MPRSKETSDEAEPLNPASLEKNISTEYIKEWPETHSVRRRAFLSKTSIVLMHLAIVALYTVIFFWVLENHALASKQDAGLMYSPAREALTMECKVLHNKLNDTNLFKGPPCPEQEEAWRGIIRNTNIRISGEDLKRMNRSSIQLADGSGDYLAALDVYHQLHCLRYVHHYIHRDYYSIPTTDIPIEQHLDHCIDLIRQVLMCRTGIAMQTYFWKPDSQFPFPDFEIEHECVAWDVFDSWSARHAVDIFDPKNLVHPTLGTVFPNGF